MPSVFVFLIFFCFFLQFFQSNNTNSQYTSLQTHFQSINIIWEPSKGISTQSFTRISARTTRIKSAVAASGDLTPLKCLNSPFLWSRMKALVLRVPKMVLKSKIRPPGQKLRRDKNCKISEEKLVYGASLRSSGLLKHERESSGTHFHSAKSNGEPSRPL